MRQILEKNIKNLLKKHKIYPSKRFGQNFLIDKKVLKKIITAASLQPRDVVLEIGPGTGILTKELAKKAKKVIAIEKDPEMVEILKEELKNFKNVKVIQTDILKIKPKSYKLKPKTYKMVANLPYYLTSPVLRKFLEAKSPPKEMILMVQKEVAQRIVAKPPNMNLLAISVQFYVRPVRNRRFSNGARPKIISYVSKKSFWPQPKVDSAIIKLVISDQRLAISKNLFFKIVRAGFSQPRKQIINNLAKGLKIDKEKIRNWLLKNKIRPQRRAETLTLKDWQKLTKTFVF